MDFVQNIGRAKNLSQQFVSNVECQRKSKLFKTHICQAKSRVKPTVKYKLSCYCQLIYIDLDLKFSEVCLQLEKSIT